MPPFAALKPSGLLLVASLSSEHEFLPLSELFERIAAAGTQQQAEKDPAQSCAAFATGLGVSTKLLSSSSSYIEIIPYINYSNYFQRYTFALSPTRCI